MAIYDHIIIININVFELYSIDLPVKRNIVLINRNTEKVYTSVVMWNFEKSVLNWVF